MYNIMNKIIIAIVVASVFFVFQSQLIRRTNKKVLQLIPLYIIFAAYISSIVIFFVDYNINSGVHFYGIVAFVIAATATVALIGAGIAWLYEKV